MHRSLLAALVALSVNSPAEEWRYWTWPGEARMAASSGRTAWFATSGGVFEWNLDQNTSRLHQRNDGLPSTRLVSIVTQSDGSVWTVSEQGDLAVLRPGNSTWESRGTYGAKPNPWTFTPRAMVIHRNPRTGKEVLVLGGSKGLSFFPTDGQIALDWTDQFGTLGKREVRSIHLSGDTLWVGLMGGLARIVPPWDSLGNNRAFVFDPARWTALQVTDPTDSYDALYPTDVGVTWQSNFTFGNHQILLNQGGLFWKGSFFDITGLVDPLGSYLIYPVHAIESGMDLLVSSANTQGIEVYSKGPLLLKSGAGFRAPAFPSNGFPTTPPPRIAIEPGGIVTAWSENRVLTWSRSQNAWTTPWTKEFFQKIPQIGNNDETYAEDLNSFLRAPDRSVWVGPWGYGLWGAIPVPGTDTLQWHSWDHSNSCLENVIATVSNFPSVAVLGTSETELWGVQYSVNAGVDSLVLFRTPLDLSDSLRCWKFASLSQVPHGGLLVRGDRLWVASRNALTTLRKPTTDQASAASLYRRPGDFRRIKAIDLNGQGAILTLGPSDVSVILESRIDTVIATSLHQTTPITTRQEWKDFDVDGLGQIWAAGAEGIDVLRLEATDQGWIFTKVREIRQSDGLPSDNIASIAIDPTSGTVAVSTDAGIGSWSSPYRPLPTKLETSKTRVWPNPLRTRSHRELVVDGATATSEFYLHAADGRLVLHLGPEQQVGGYFHWPTPAPSDLRPGVYRWTLKDGKRTVGGPLIVAE